MGQEYPEGLEVPENLFVEFLERSLDLTLTGWQATTFYAFRQRYITGLPS